MPTVAGAARTFEAQTSKRRTSKRRIVGHAVGLTSEDMAAIVGRTTDVDDVVIIRSDWLTPQDAAAYLPVGEDMIKDAFVQGLEYADLGYRTHRTRKPWVDRYAESRRRRHAAAVKDGNERVVQKAQSSLSEQDE